MVQSKPQSKSRQPDWTDGVWNMTKTVYDIFFAIGRGVLTRELPIFKCLAVGVALHFCIGFRLDWHLLRTLGLEALYPAHYSPYLFWPYYAATVLSGFWGWAVYDIVRRRKQQECFSQALSVAGMKVTSNDPRIIRKIRRPDGSGTFIIRRTVQPIEAFRKAKENIEAAFSFHISGMREDRRKSLVKIDYTYEPQSLPSCVEGSRFTNVKPGEFIVGESLDSQVKTSFSETPHFLIAGETSSGKSTFLRYFITQTCATSPYTDLWLIDLKGGLEFSLFKGLANTKVYEDLSGSCQALRKLDAEMDKRFKLLNQAGVQNFESYNKVRYERGMDADHLYRQVVVVDEGAELYVAGRGRKTEMDRARATMSRIARQGRAVGINLVFATQRPDTRSLDSQIKSNLAGKLCFQMGDTTSSMTILGNGAAAKLPSIAGRAIWQQGLKSIEVQTPFLSPEEAREALKDLRCPSGEEGYKVETQKLVECDPELDC